VWGESSVVWCQNVDGKKKGMKQRNGLTEKKWPFVDKPELKTNGSKNFDCGRDIKIFQFWTLN
jgi:hypothetical protein